MNKCKEWKGAYEQEMDTWNDAHSFQVIKNKIILFITVGRDIAKQMICLLETYFIYNLHLKYS